MGIAHRATTTTKLDIAGNQIVVNMPSGIVDGDVLTMFLSMAGSNAAVSTGGDIDRWTRAGTGQQADGSGLTTDVYKRIASSEPSTQTINMVGSPKVVAVVAAHSGVDQTTPMDATPTSVNETAGGNPTAHTTPDITSVTANAWLLSYIGTRETLTGQSTFTTSDGSDAERADAVTAATNAASGALYDSNRDLAVGTYSRTITGSSGTSTACMWSLVFRPAASGQTVTATQPVETDIAPAATAAHTATLAAATETDTGQPAAAAHGAITTAATETDSGLAPTAVHAVATGRADETGSGQPASATKSVTAGSALEANTALPATVAYLLTAGLPAETDTALPVMAVHVSPALTVTETDTALPVTASKTLTATLAAEADTALPALVDTAVGPAVETGLALPAAARHALTAGQAVEADTALRALAIRVPTSRNHTPAPAAHRPPTPVGTPASRAYTPAPGTPRG